MISKTLILDTSRESSVYGEAKRCRLQLKRMEEVETAALLVDPQVRRFGGRMGVSARAQFCVCVCKRPFSPEVRRVRSLQGAQTALTFYHLLCGSLFFLPPLSIRMSHQWIRKRRSFKPEKQQS